MRTTRTARRSVGVLTLIAIASLFLSACSDSDDTTTATTATDHNAQDVTFAKEMIPHHGQAVQMASQAEKSASSQQVKDLAKRIEGAQQPEIDKMNSWLTSWGEKTVDPNMAMSEHAGHSSMPGMMSSEDMSKMMASHGSDFDRMFLQMMIEHHKGAIEMANTEKAKGLHADAKTMAESIATSQQAEVNEMEQLLTQIK